jgi:hypothetical protein
MIEGLEVFGDGNGDEFKAKKPALDKERVRKWRVLDNRWLGQVGEWARRKPNGGANPESTAEYRDAVTRGGPNGELVC